jgi:hypothetical protein
MRTSGKQIDCLKSSGMEENTLLISLSNNGAAHFVLETTHDAL